MGEKDVMRPVQLPSDVPGQLLLHSMPGRYELWEVFLAQAKELGLDRIACLAGPEEIARKSPVYAEALEQGLPYPVDFFPIPDFAQPSDPEAFAVFLDRLVIHLREGERILLHCAGGIGRTGTACACLLSRLGCPVDEALDRTRAAGSEPETPSQQRWVDEFATA